MILQKFKQLSTTAITILKSCCKFLNPKNWSWSSFKKVIHFFFNVSVSIFFLIFAYDVLIHTENESDSTKQSCNVSGIKLQGTMLTYIPKTDIDTEKTIEDEVSSEEIVAAIDKAEKDEKIKAIILEIDSPGGLPVAAEEITNALKNSNKPTVALIRSTGASAAYFAATGTDRIFASSYSDVGSIGVTMSYLDNADQIKKDGLTYNSLSSGKFKDMGDPNKILSKEEKNLVMRDVNTTYEDFMKVVAKNRNLDIEKVKKIADGSTMLGEMALQNGLIDEIGGIDEVKRYLEEKIGEEVEVCW